LNQRLISSGGLVWQSPRIVSWYRPRATLSELAWQYLQYGFWKVAAIRRHCRLACWRNLVPGSCFLAAIILPLCAAAASPGGMRGCARNFLMRGCSSRHVPHGLFRVGIFDCEAKWLEIPALYASGFCRLSFVICARIYSGAPGASRGRGTPPERDTKSSYGQSPDSFSSFFNSIHISGIALEKQKSSGRRIFP